MHLGMHSNEFDPSEGRPMKIFIWRHSKLFSSWSMFYEPHVYRDNYLQAEIAVLADSEASRVTKAACLV